MVWLVSQEEKGISLVKMHTSSALYTQVWLCYAVCLQLHGLLWRGLERLLSEREGGIPAGCVEFPLIP